MSGTQILTSTQTPTPSSNAISTQAPSPNDTAVIGTASAITDAGGNVWTITNGGQVAVNGIADPTRSDPIRQQRT